MQPYATIIIPTCQEGCSCLSTLWCYVEVVKCQTIPQEVIHVRCADVLGIVQAIVIKPEVINQYEDDVGPLASWEGRDWDTANGSCSDSTVQALLVRRR